MDKNNTDQDVKKLLDKLEEQEQEQNEIKYAWEDSKNKRLREEEDNRERERMRDKTMADEIYAKLSADLRGQIAYLQHMINIYDKSELMDIKKIPKDELEEKRDQLIKDLKNLPDKLRLKDDH